ncbi:hypothetical protein [Bacillus altitudinis]|uniref:hypothetical protein n=1 Tax=Bacillus altitudinis TaxID=293387 RepID=UPI0011A4CB93|nr:hypothetical protein [Bacillus altitudinis]
MRKVLLGEVGRGVEDEIDGKGFGLLLGKSDEDGEKEMGYLERFKEKEVVGVMGVRKEGEWDL